MANFAKLDSSNNVTHVYVVSQGVITDENGVEQEQLGIDFLNSHHGVGWYKGTYKDGSKRKNYAGKGWKYDTSRDAFIPPQTYPSWTLDEDTCLWNSPVPYPDDGNHYAWNESTKAWDAIA